MIKFLKNSAKLCFTWTLWKLKNKNRRKLIRFQGYQGIKGWHCFPESERKPQNFKVFKGLFKGRKNSMDFQGFQGF